MKKSIYITSCCLILILLTLQYAYAARVALPRTGQTLCYNTTTNLATACTNTAGQDGNKLKGVAWPNPRFTDNLINGVSNGTVTDNLTGLIWLKDAGCFATVGGIAKGTTPESSVLTWANALAWSNALASGSCNLNDGSTVGQWRLPNSNELASLVDLSVFSPALPLGHPFINVYSNSYWSSSIYAGDTNNAWFVAMNGGLVVYAPRSNNGFVWPVRGGQ
jgi:hypothetical protein